jgi:alpha-ketoglutarate-dependent taurine dioxygenase
MSNRALRFYQSLSVVPGLVALVPLLLLTPLPLVILVFTILEAHVFLALAFRRYARQLHRQEQSLKFKDRALEAHNLMAAVCERTGAVPPRHIKITAKRLARYDSMVDAIEMSPRLLDGAQIDPERAQAIVAHELGHRRQHLRGSTYLCSLIKTYLVFVAPLCLLLSGSAIESIIAAAQSVVLFYAMTPLDRYGSRHIEADADAYARSLGYGPALIRQLNSYTDSSSHPLLRSHPTAAKRVRALAP